MANTVGHADPFQVDADGSSAGPHHATSILTVAINKGNSLLTKASDGSVDGLPIVLARFIARETGAALRLRVVEGAAAVIKALTCGASDIGFLAVDPSRATDLAFTQPFIRMEATFMVRSGKGAQCANIDRQGTMVAVIARSGPDLLLSRLLRSAKIQRFETFDACILALRDGTVGAVGGLRHSLAERALQDGSLEIVADRFGEIDQCVCVARSRSDRIASLNSLLRRFAAA